MDSEAGDWQFTKLNSFFSDIVTEKIHGLNTPFLFVGAWRTFFNWHIEDLDLSAINLLHEGAPKTWYCVHPDDRRKFERILADLFKEDAMHCPNFMRHKQIFLNPYKLKEQYPTLRISKTFQHEGEISLAFAEAYHSGFNMGFNIAEAVNYGTLDWFERYGRFRGCKCPLEIGVKLEHDQMMANLKKSSAS
jgi:[histone H3]-trimethyl-L-lysine9/36 demethylase